MIFNGKYRPKEIKYKGKTIARITPFIGKEDLPEYRAIRREEDIHFNLIKKTMRRRPKMTLYPVYRNDKEKITYQDGRMK